MPPFGQADGIGEIPAAGHDDQAATAAPRALA
jgi:hypothetical protein